MNTPGKIKIGLSALALTGLALGGFASHGLTVSAFAASAANAKKAVSEAKAARKALAKRDGAGAVVHAERAVANDPMNADHRALLGQSYLLAGRFASAAQALNDALTLAPQNGEVARNLALAKIAQGDWAGARALLQDHAEIIPASDRGLAFALAGDPVTAVQILGPAVRDASATAKTRQNLALSLALAGRWSEAAQLAAMDVAPGQLQARMTQWVAFARPANAYDQVASLLGVQPVADPGQPAALALAQQPNLAVAAAAAPQPLADPVDAYMPGKSAEGPVQTAAAELPSEPQLEQLAGTGAQVVFGAREEIVQAVARRASAAPARVRPAETQAVAAKRIPGTYYVQLGAYANAGVARDAWGRYARRVPELAQSMPHAASVSTRAGRFTRLSVGAYARSDANALCREIKASGGACFVRTAAGDAVAAWAPRRAQLASR